MKKYVWCLLSILITNAALAQLDDKTVVKPAQPKKWLTFPLADMRLLPGSPFHRAMLLDQQYLLDTDLEKMLNGPRRRAGLPVVNTPYAGSNQPANTRPNDLPHYLSAIALMYGQTGNPQLLARINYLIDALNACADKTDARLAAGDTTVRTRLQRTYDRVLSGRLELRAPDELGYPWNGPGDMGNSWYGVHKLLAAYRDAYLYANNQNALILWKRESEPITRFALRVNPDLFDDMLDVEHGGMNEVFADLYALTGDRRYMAVSERFNHQKVILNIANGKDVLSGRHANMQVPTFVGTARQYQLTGDPVAHRATTNFLTIVQRDHLTAIGGNSRNERFGDPGLLSKRLGFTTAETCNTYNMLKVALNQFESTGDFGQMNFFERALYNHILASQDPDSGGVTYYVSHAPGGFKSYSRGFELEGVWCCVGTGMENHAKYGEAVFFHNATDLLVNLFIPATLNWPRTGLQLKQETHFPEQDDVQLTIQQAGHFHGPIWVRYPAWAKAGSVRVTINGKPVTISGKPGGAFKLTHAWKSGDVIRLTIPQPLHLEPTPDDPNLVAVLRGPLVLAAQLGADRMPDDRVRYAMRYNTWQNPTDDIPTLIADSTNLTDWLRPVAGHPLTYQTKNVGHLNGQVHDLTFRPFYQTHHQRYALYTKLFSPRQWTTRQTQTSDELNVARSADEKAHALTGEHTDTTTLKDDHHFWENNRTGRVARNGGWFAYDLKLNPTAPKQYVVVTYWGSAPVSSRFDVLADGKLLRTEDLYDRHPLQYFEEVYELPAGVVQGKGKVTIRFQANPQTDPVHQPEPGKPRASGTQTNPGADGINKEGAAQSAQNQAKLSPLSSVQVGPVFSLKITTDPTAFPNYSFY